MYVVNIDRDREDREKGEGGNEGDDAVAHIFLRRGGGCVASCEKREPLERYDLSSLSSV